MARALVRFPSSSIKLDILQGSALSGIKRNPIRVAYSQPDVASVELTDTMRRRLEGLGVTVYDDVKFSVFGPNSRADGGHDVDSWVENAGIGVGSEFTMRDVMEQIRAPAAWVNARGRGVVIAVVDTGILGDLPEIGTKRRSDFDLSTHFAGDHWADTNGHGTMCAAIAAGSTADGGRYDGVAPEATVLAARTNLHSEDLFDVFDELIRLKRQGQLAGPLVVSNSYGLYTCVSPNVLPQDHPYVSAVVDLIDAGAFVSFAAGNNHFNLLCNHDPADCSPNSIWGVNSHDRVMSIGAVNRDLSNSDRRTPHANSSRGPGEWSDRFPKPDCVAPTYGEVRWRDTYQPMAWWGTSGACPQVAGLAALILSVAPRLAPDEVAAIIRESCSRLPAPHNCVGHGLIDCGDAVERAMAAGAGV